MPTPKGMVARRQMLQWIVAGTQVQAKTIKPILAISVTVYTVNNSVTHGISTAPTHADGRRVSGAM
jgi:hypothetical protein